MSTRTAWSASIASSAVPATAAISNASSLSTIRDRTDSSDHRIVDDHQPDAAVFYVAGRLAVPRTGERPLHGRALRRRRRAEA